MNYWLAAFGIAAGALFLFKVAYGVSTALVLSMTGGALFVSTARARIDIALSAIEGESHRLAVDLGCGDGRILRAAADRLGIRAVGYEVNPLAYVKCRLLCLFHRNVDIRCRNFWHADLSEADVVFCYLYPDVLKKLSAKLREELRPGAEVISFNFPLPGFTPCQILRPTGALHGDPIFVYRS